MESDFVVIEQQEESLNWKRVDLDLIKKGILCYEGGNALEQIALRSYGCPIQPVGILVSALGRGVRTRWSLRSLLTQTILWQNKMTNETFYKDSHKSLKYKAGVGEQIALLKNVLSSRALFQLFHSIFGINVFQWFFFLCMFLLGRHELKNPDQYFCYSIWDENSCFLKVITCR